MTDKKIQKLTKIVNEKVIETSQKIIDLTTNNDEPSFMIALAAITFALTSSLEILFEDINHPKNSQAEEVVLTKLADSIDRLVALSVSFIKTEVKVRSEKKIN